MDIILFKIAVILSIVLFILPKRFQYYGGLFLHLSIIGISSVWATQTMFLGNGNLHLAFMSFLGKPLYLEIDQLSAFFILVINFTIFTGMIYAKSYLAPYEHKKSAMEFALHYFSFLWLHISMLLVVMFHDALAFLIIWEVMSLSSFFLVIFESEKKETIKIGMKYLIQMHIGVVFLMTAFLWAYVQSGAEFSFDGLAVYFQAHNPFYLFLVFFIGFGIKAGFIPFHTWLPHAHPAAPSHVSGVMSGVMIKMGIYGILRVLMYIHHDLLFIGLFIFSISLISGLAGVSLAIVQHDIKKLLAYHSIENIGIIGIGIGLGVIGLAIHNPMMAVLGFAGGILHILNHSLFKSLLFYTTGSVYRQTHTRNIEQLGGLIKKMPKTALFFLLGALAISGLPPFNGFISEFLIYAGMFKSLESATLFTDGVLLFGFSGLAIIGGLAIFCFTKVFSIVFLGNPRSKAVEQAGEVDSSMLFPNFLIGFMILLIGLFPLLFMGPLANVVRGFTNETAAITQILPMLHKVSQSSGIFIIIIGVVWLLRAWQQKSKKIEKNKTWGCAYTAADPALHQYTATSFADNFGQLSQQIVHMKKEFKEFDELEIFPEERTFDTSSSDIFEDYLINKPASKSLAWLKKIAVFQTGKIQHYLLYSLLFVLLIFLLTILNWI
jgi:formate hydrogenlyase subunit 3/multisubunit Na+/H+ antiporter MnhD subunit